MRTPDSTPGTAGGPKIRAVVVDVSTTMVRSLADYLQTIPSIVLAAVAATGAEAIEICARLKPDLVLLDFALPDMNGLDAARALRRLSPTTRVVVISQYSTYLAQAGPWPDVDAVVDKIDFGRQLPALIERLSQMPR